MGHFKTSVIAVATLVLFGGGCLSGPENITVAIDIPTRVSQGETFEIIADVTNTGDETQTLDSIDIGDEYIEGIAILRSDPMYSETFHIPLDNTMSHTIQRDIGPSETLTVTFTVEALHAGDYIGAFDVCINSGGNCLFYSIRTLVE